MAIYARGRQEFADSYAEHDDVALRTSLIDLDVHLKYEKQLRNLQLQESRLQRRYEKEMAELRRLQQERRATELPVETSQRNVAPGFVFSNDVSPAELTPIFAPLAASSESPNRLGLEAGY
jgi:hypothetical protein